MEKYYDDNIKIITKHIKGASIHFIVNKRYAVHYDAVYDTTNAQDIPPYIFKLQDNLLKDKLL